MPVKLAQGMQLDGFELLAPLHQGGMATLWRVAHPDHPGPLHGAVEARYQSCE